MILLTEDDYDALTGQMDAAMLAVYMARASEIPSVKTRKSYENCLCAYAIGDLMFSFLDAKLYYRLVKQANGRYDTDRNVTALTSCTSVGCDRRVNGSNTWTSHTGFGEEGKVRALFRELTVEAAQRCANALVDSVKDFLNGDVRLGLNLPFMTAVAGHVLVHDGCTGQMLPDSWTGLCTGTEGQTRFWYIGRSRGERSYSALQEATAGAALNACNLIAFTEMCEA